MKKDEILKGLCYYDGRNPDNNLEDGVSSKSGACYCDNCFSGRHRISEGYLSLYESVEVFLIGVKNGDVIIYPNSDDTPNYILIIEKGLK